MQLGKLIVSLREKIHNRTEKQLNDMMNPITKTLGDAKEFIDKITKKGFMEFFVKMAQGSYNKKALGDIHQVIWNMGVPMLV
jgi:hypothetical protein